MESIGDDITWEIILHLDVVSIVYLSSTSKLLWNISKTKRVVDRINQYKKFFKYQQWNKGLMESVKNSNFNQIAFFIEKGADCISKALEQALKQGNKTLVLYLEQFGVRVSDWKRAFPNACEGGNQELVDYVLQKLLKINELTMNYGLIGAATAGNLPLIKYLISLPEQVTFGWHFMMIEAAKFKYEHIIQFIVDQGHNAWNAALEGAISGGHVDLAEFFWGKTNQIPIHTSLALAAEGGHKEMIEWLIAKGEHSWNNGLQGAVQGGHRDLVDFFIEKGANNWDVGLWYAAYNGHLDLVKFFWEKGVSRKYLELGLQDACNYDQREVILELIELGASSWNESLVQAAQHGHTSLVKFLIAKGATDLQGALTGAYLEEHHEIRKYLESLGARWSPELDPWSEMVHSLSDQLPTI